MYKEFAEIYDDLMGDFPYKDYQNIIEKYIPPKGKVLEIGCGTGKMTSFFFQKGAEVHALDTSLDMLSIAKKKLPAVSFYHGALCQLELEKFDQIYACVDILNYYLTRDDLKTFLQSVKNHMKGDFLFDLRNPGVMEEQLADRIFYYEEDRADLIWINEKERDILYQEIIIYWKNNNTYSKSTEIHHQKIWLPETIESLVEEIGLKLKKKIISQERLYYLCGLTE